VENSVYELGGAKYTLPALYAKTYPILRIMIHLELTILLNIGN